MALFPYTASEIVTLLRESGFYPEKQLRKVRQIFLEMADSFESLDTVLAPLLEDAGVDTTIEDIDMLDAGATDYHSALSGDGTKKFAPTCAVFVCTADDALNGDVEVKIGLSLGGTEILPATSLTGLDEAGETFVVQMAAHFVEIPDNSDIHVQVSSADTGTAGTMKCYLTGKAL